MKSLKNIGSQLAGIPLLSDDVVEFHAARLLLLLDICGQKGQIEGLTKLAKLDFFVRYPQFFNVAAQAVNSSISSELSVVESSMVRHHYGPWDKRYYQILAYLESKQLIEVNNGKANTYNFLLTNAGKEAARQLTADSSFDELCNHMKIVARTFKGKKGSYLKNLIYELFDEEVAQKDLGEMIQP